MGWNDGYRMRLALATVAALAGAAGVTVLLSADASPGFRGIVVARSELPAGFRPAARPAAAADDGVWLPLVAAGRFGTTAPAGVLPHVAVGGAARPVPMPAPNVYPGTAVADELGVVWFELVRGDGASSTVDSGPALRNVRDEIGWLTADGRVHDLPLTGARPAIRALAPARGGGVWYTAYTGAGEVFGRADAAGRVRQCSAPRSSADLTGIAQASARTVWLLDGVACTVWREDPGSGPVTTPLPLSPSARYLAGCGPLLPGPSGGVRLPVAGRGMVTVGSTGRSTGSVALPAILGDTGQIVGVDAVPVVVRLGRDGTVHRYTPLGSLPTPTASVSPNDKPAGAYRANLESQPGATAVSPHGVVWLVSPSTVDELG